MNGNSKSHEYPKISKSLPRRTIIFRNGPRLGFVSRLDGGLSALKKWLELFGAAIALIVAIGIIFKPIGTYLNVLSAWRFGASGIIKYDIGTHKLIKGGTEHDRFEKRMPTSTGQLNLLKNGEREFLDIRQGDIVQAISSVRFHVYNDCANENNKNCASAPVVFELQKGDCAIVLKILYEDNSPHSLKYF